MSKTRTKKLITLAFLSILAYSAMVLIRIPVVLFLKYEPKDIVILIGGFIFGPLSAFAMSIVVSFIEMFTVSDAGIIGCVMNIVSTCSFVCPAAVFYKKNRTIKGAVSGLVVGGLFMTMIMMLWNYFLTPLYMGIPREAVAKLLLPAFLPFNLLKAGLNAAIAMLIYKPVTTALRRSNLLPAPEESGKRKINISVILLSFLLMITCVLFVLVLQGRI